MGRKWFGKQLLHGKRSVWKTAAFFFCMLLFLSATTPARAGVVRKGALYVGTVPADALKTFQEAEVKNAALDSCDAEFRSTLSIPEFSFTTTGTVKARNAGSEDLQMLVISDAESEALGGKLLHSETFYRDGYLYTMVGSADDGSTAVKQKMKLPLAGAVAGLSATVDPLSAETSYITSMQMKRDGGTTVITYTADPEKLNRSVSEMSNSLFSGIDTLRPSAGGSGSAGIGRFTSFRGEVTIGPDGYYTEKKVNMTLAMPEGMFGGEVMSDETVVTILNPGAPVDFELPSGEDYTEITGDAGANP